MIEVVKVDNSLKETTVHRFAGNYKTHSIGKTIHYFVKWLNRTIGKEWKSVSDSTVYGFYAVDEKTGDCYSLK